MDAFERAGLVDLLAVEPTIRLDIKYSTHDNFYGQPVYQEARAYLRHPVAEQLSRVQKELQKQGLGLLVFDAYRPFSVQERFWAHTPNPDFLAKPIRDNGRMIDGSKHNRGVAVDLTLVDAQGQPLEMPTPFDEFSDRAWRHYTGGSEASRRHRELLETAMVAQGFVPLISEWWHFEIAEFLSYELLDLPL
jgi:beta-N-acetylhexosaminidase/D-alanyl-D-alanine dipeptidase